MKILIAKDDTTRLATEARRRIHALERWMPLGLLLGSVIVLAAGLRPMRPAPPPSSPANPALPGASS